MFLFNKGAHISDCVNGIAMEPYLDGKASVDHVDDATAEYFKGVPGWEILEAKDPDAKLPEPVTVTAVNEDAQSEQDLFDAMTAPAAEPAAEAEGAQPEADAGSEPAADPAAAEGDKPEAEAATETAAEPAAEAAPAKGKKAAAK